MYLQFLQSSFPANEPVPRIFYDFTPVEESYIAKPIKAAKATTGNLDLL